jgi:curli production assembly/transport component CsgE
MASIHPWFIRSCVLFALWLPSLAPGAAPLGMTIDQTTTVRGQEFYRRFAELWRETPYADTAVISVSERPSARTGSQVSINYRQKPVFQAQLPTGVGAIASLSEQAVQHVIDNVAQADLQQLALDADLGRDEI